MDNIHKNSSWNDPWKVARHGVSGIPPKENIRPGRDGRNNQLTQTRNDSHQTPINRLMKPAALLTILLLFLLASPSPATTYYVDINSPDPTPPYTSWATAATDIQSAVNQTTNGDLVLVNPGVYQSGGYVAPDGTLTALVVSNSVTVQSMNGASATFIDGSDAMRGIYLQNTSVLVGFTITNGTAGTNSGGGIYCQNTGQTVSNCVIIGNSSDAVGPQDNGTGPGAGGVYNGTLYNCEIITNSAIYGNGGGAQNSTLINCLLTGNQAGVGGGAYGGQLYNCTVVANDANAGIGGGVADVNAINCIIYDNNVNWFAGSYGYCCTTQLPSGTGNITNAPLFVNEAGGDFHLQSNSPCIDTGNNSDVITTYDLDGNPRIVNGIVDMGAFEYQNPNLAVLAIAVNYTNVATGFPVQLRAVLNAGLATTSLWDLGDGSFATNQISVAHSWTSPGTYTVTLTASNSFVTSNAVATATIWVSSDIAYVNVNSQTAMQPYSSWSTAATNIQSAINAVVVPGGIVLVSNGVYNTSSTTSPDGAQNRVAVTLPVILESFNGPAVTFINGGATCRCVYLTNGATLNGFTLTEGSTTNGGGVYAASTNATITNCVIKSCSANSEGGGTYSGTFYDCSLLNNNSSGDGGGAYGGAFDNCTIANNSATTYGGGVYSGVGSPLIVENCIIVSNSASAGGGVFNFPSSSPAPRFDCLTNCFVTNCVISYNSAGDFGSATVDAYLDNCTVSSNKISYIAAAAAAGYLVNCTFVGNQGFAARPNVSDLLNDSAEVLSNCTLIANGGGVDDCQAYGCTLLQNNGEGGAIYSTLVNCLISSNTAIGNGGGAYYCTLTNCSLTFNLATGGAYGGGAYYSTLNDCSLAFNQASDGGGADNCTLINCTLVGNAVGRSGGGGGAAASMLNQCLIMQNIATNEGGGVMSCSLNNCLIISNVACVYANRSAYGGGAYLSTLTNCILADNVGTNGGGAYLSELVNCTVTANTAVLGGGAFNCTNYNSILYYNMNGDVYAAAKQFSLNYCCASVPTNGVRNITNAPLFVNLTGGDYHLQSSSPCINSGNNTYISSATDLDGNPRIQGGTADIGAYEYQTPTSVISYAYLEQYSLPTDGSVDFADLDATAFNVYQDWIAGLNPTNSASVLAMLTPVTTNTATGVTVTWQSVSGIPYFLQRSTNLVSQPPFSTIQNNIIGQANTTSFTDTSATNTVPYFYRVGVVAP
jgi:hypothetical protein